MAVTGRLGLLALFGALVVGLLLPSDTGILAVGGVLLVLVVVDLVLAGSVRPLTFSRSGDTSVRLGEPCEGTVVVANPGRRTGGGQLRDAWPPSAGASERHSLRVPPGERRALVTALRPTRR